MVGEVARRKAFCPWVFGVGGYDWTVTPPSDPTIATSIAKSQVVAFPDEVALSQGGRSGPDRGRRRVIGSFLKGRL